MATYFRPNQPPAENSAPVATVAAEAGAGARGEGINGGREGSTTNTVGAGEEQKNSDKPLDAAVGSSEVGGVRPDGQKWEHFEDDSAEQTARFRGRKLM